MPRIYHYQKDNGYRKQGDDHYPLRDFHQKDDIRKNPLENQTIDKGSSRTDPLGSIGTSLGKTCLGVSTTKGCRKIFLERCNFPQHKIKGNNSLRSAQ